jgi:bacteriorhodopsin
MLTRASQRAGKIRYAAIAWLIGLPIPIIILAWLIGGVDW